MTEEEKTRITELRGNGVGYASISKMLGLSENTVKTFCRRNGLTGQRSSLTGEKGNAHREKHICLYCGKPVEQKPGRKEKKFCSDSCRNRWWNSHLDLVDRRATREVVCENCGKKFTVYGSTPRKYCCHDCYIQHRFGGRKDE